MFNELVLLWEGLSLLVLSVSTYSTTGTKLRYENVKTARLDSAVCLSPSLSLSVPVLVATPAFLHWHTVGNLACILRCESTKILVRAMPRVSLVGIWRTVLLRSHNHTLELLIVFEVQLAQYTSRLKSCLTKTQLHHIGHQAIYRNQAPTTSPNVPTPHRQLVNLFVI